jgi:uncharacterized protein (DUF58 family)
MEEAPKRAQITRLLENRVLSRLELMRISSSRRFTNRHRGEHLVGRGGTSTEFSDFRDYTPGDDVRFVDWNAFARLNRPYIKLFELEEEMHVAILVDASASMLFEDKLLRAQQLAAAFGVMGLLGDERLSVTAFSQGGHGDPPLRRFEPCTGRANLMKLFAFCERIEGSGEAPLERGIEGFLQRHVGKGMAIVLSDFLTFGDVKRAFNRVFSAGLEILGIQILGPSEIDPELAGDLRLVDAESESTLDISSAADLLGIYQEHREGLARELATLCRQRSGKFVAISAADPLETVLFGLLQRRGWIA